MKNKLYNCSPVLNFEMGEIGGAVVNMATNNPSVYIPHMLYKSNSVNGLDLCYYLSDNNSNFGAFQVEFEGKFSYDIKLNAPGVTYIYLLFPGGSAETFVYDSSDMTYKSRMNNRYITSIYNEETCSFVFTMFDEEEKKYTFKKYTDDKYYLESIEFYIGKKILISRDVAGRISSVYDDFSNERLNIIYTNDSINVSISRKDIADVERKIYEYVISLNNNLLTISSFLVADNSSKIIKKTEYNFTETKLELFDYYGGLFNKYEFIKDELGRIISFINFDKMIYSIEYESNNIAKVTNNVDDSFNIKYRWDNNNRLTHIYDLNSKTFKNYSYDNFGRLVVESDELFSDDKLQNLNYKCNANEILYDGTVDDLYSVILNVQSDGLLKFKLYISFENTDNGYVQLSEGQNNYDFIIEHDGNLDYVYSSFSNIKYNKVKVEIEVLNNESTNYNFDYYLFNAGFTKNYYYEDNKLVNVNNYGSLTNVKNFNKNVKTSLSGKKAYDSYGRMIKYEDNNGNTLINSYDENGNLTKVEKFKKDDQNNYVYRTIKEYKYNFYNELEYQKDQEIDLYAHKITRDINGLPKETNKLYVYNIESSEYDAKIEDKSKEYLYNNADNTFLSEIKENNNSIYYTYENELIRSIKTGQKSYEFYGNQNNTNRISISVENDGEVLENKFLEFEYTLDNEMIINNLIKTKKENHGIYYFEYYDDLSLKKVMFKDESCDYVELLFEVEYTMINNISVISRIKQYNSETNSFKYTKYLYNEYGVLVGKEDDGRNTSTFVLQNQIDKITINEGNGYLSHNMYETNQNEIFADYVRSLSSKIRVCNFDVEANIDSNISTCLLLYNSIVDVTSSNNTKNVDLGKLQNGNTFDYDNVILKNNNTNYYIVSSGSEIEFPVSNVNSTKQISFEYRKQIRYRNLTVLMKLPNILGEQFDLYLVQFDTSTIKSEILLCYNYIDEDDNYVYLKALTSGNNGQKSIETDKVDNFISLTITDESIVLYVNGQQLKYNINGVPYYSFNKVFIGYKNCKLKSLYDYIQHSPSTNFEVSNIIISKDTILSLERIDVLYYKLIMDNSNDNNICLSKENQFSNTTKFSNIKNITNEIDIISFDSNFVSVGGINPEYNPLLSSLNNLAKKKTIFKKDTLKKSYVYVLTGTSLKYNIDNTKYNESCIFSFDYYINDNLSECFFLKMMSQNKSISIYSVGNVMNIDDSNGNTFNFTVSIKTWERISICVSRLFDNCSNPTNSIQVKVFINNVKKVDFVTSFENDFQGFDSLEVDYEKEFDSKTGQISDLILCNNSSNFTELTQLGYITREYNYLGNLSLENINSQNNNIFTKTFIYNNLKTVNLIKSEEFELPNNLCKAGRILYQYNEQKNALCLQTLTFSKENQVDDVEYDYFSEKHEFTPDFDGTIKSEIISYKYGDGNYINKSYGYNVDNYGNITTVGNIEFKYDIFNRMNEIIYNGEVKKVLYYDSSDMISLYPKIIDDAELFWKANQLVKIEKSGKTINYLYNAKGLRVQKKVGIQGEITEFDYFYDINDRLICEVSKTHNGITRKLDFLYQNNDIVGFVYNNQTYYYVRDALRTIRYIIDNNGKIVVFYIYNAYGKIIDILGEMKNTIGVINPIRYKGYYYDNETGLFWLSSRYYSPELCRFISPDDVGYLDPSSINGLNLYSYCYNNPISYSDPSGHIPVDTIIDIGFAFWSFIDLLRNPSWENAGWFALDLACLIIPYATGGSTAVKGIVKGVNGADNLLDASKVPEYIMRNIDDVVILGQNMDRVHDASRKIGGGIIYGGLDDFASIKLKYGDEIAEALGYADNMKWIRKQAWSGKTVLNIGLEWRRLDDPIRYANSFKVCRGELFWYRAVMLGKFAAFWSHRIYRMIFGGF